MVAPVPERPAVFDEALVMRVARHRAHAGSWEAVAAEVHWPVDDLVRACDLEPAFERALARAKREVDDEAEAEFLHRTRALLRSEDDKTALNAARQLSKHLSDKRRDATRLEVEKLRADAKAAVANARRDAALAKQAERAESSDPADRPLTPEEEEHGREVFWRYQQIHAEKAGQPCAEVYVWGGTHKIGDTLPDATDERVIVLSDMTNQGRHLYWVMKYPPPTHLSDGPFPGPHTPPAVHPCPPDVADPFAAERGVGAGV